MKKINLFLLSTLFLGVISCGSDDDASGELVSVDPNPVEDTILDENTVSQGISVDGATRVTGNAPTPTGGITFTPSTTTQSAFLSNGFNIRLTAPDVATGAYLQVVQDGTPAGDYFDISLAAFRASALQNKKSGFMKNSKMMENEVEIDVDFGETVTPGKFCYLLCIYDEAGNISEPVEICVEVEAWGGNPNIVGTWNFVKAVENGNTQLLGEEDCEDTTVFCNDQTEITVENAYCDTLLSLPVTFNADGTYEYVETSKYTEINYGASSETCTATFEAEKDEKYTSRGNWAYDEEEKKLTLVEFTYIDEYDGQVNNGVEEDGYLLFDGDASVTASTLVIKQTFEEAGISETFEIFFEK